MHAGKRSTKVSILGAGLAAALSLVLAGCGSGGSAASESEGGLTTIKVGVLPITSVAALNLGVEKGFFEEEGLKVETEVAQSGAALVPAIASGQYQFGFSNNFSLILAYGKGLPVRIVRTANSADSDPTPSQEALVVSKDSGITSLKQLEGKTIAVNSLNNTPQISVMVTLEKAGVDPDSVKFVELGFPDMPLALSQGRVDAVDVSEPFLTEASKDGAVDLAHPYRDVQQDQPLSSWFTTQNYIDSNPDVVDAFARAVDRSNAYASKHTDEIRDFVPSYLDVDPKVAQKMALPRFPQGTPSVDFLEMLAGEGAKFGVIDEAPDDLNELVADAG
jgi:NitT/TauT family transport system substrate-binding protein